MIWTRTQSIRWSDERDIAVAVEGGVSVIGAKKYCGQRECFNILTILPISAFLVRSQQLWATS